MSLQMAGFLFPFKIVTLLTYGAVLVMVKSQQVPMKECQPPCHNGGTCIDPQGTCQCPVGFMGRNCEHRIVCKSISDCNHHGRCNEDGFCECVDGYYGDTCENTNKIMCYSPCRNGGTCENGRCICLDYYYGLACEFSNPCQSHEVTQERSTYSYETNDCNGHGFCSQGFCICHDGYSGEHCQNYNDSSDYVEDYTSVNISYFYYIIAGAGVVAITLVCFVTRVACRRRIVTQSHQHSLGRFVQRGGQRQAGNRGLVIVPTAISTTSNGINMTPPLDDLPPAYDHIVHNMCDIESGQIVNDIVGDLPPSYEEAMRLKEESLTFEPTGAMTESTDLSANGNDDSTSGIFRNETEIGSVPEHT
ncbi:uncharacterized protein LOC144436999 isoform X2 [Glandiceps talaboti]